MRRQWARPLATASAAAVKAPLVSATPVVTANPTATQGQPGVYWVDIYTGDQRGGGTDAVASIQFAGDKGESKVFSFDDGFIRGTRRRLRVDAGERLGNLKRLRLVREAAQLSITQVDKGWYVDRVEVTSEASGNVYVFPCKRWLGESECGGVSGPNAIDLLQSADADAGGTAATGTGARLVLRSGAAAVAHPSKDLRASVGKTSGRAGEDAYFASEGPAGHYSWGVADGVFAWREQGIDAGLYAAALTEGAAAAATAGATDAVELLAAGAREAARRQVQGSSTLCVLCLDADRGRLTSAVMGDSGFMVLGTDGAAGHRAFGTQALEVKYRSPHQEHEFGRPYQLGHHESADPPNVCLTATVPVGEGDVLVLGTDGLWDNLGDEDIAAAATEALAAKAGASALARTLVARAHAASINKDAVTPYSVGATEAFDMVYTGGKKDDITVLVAIVDAA